MASYMFRLILEYDWLPHQDDPDKRLSHMDGVVLITGSIAFAWAIALVRLFGFGLYNYKYSALHADDGIRSKFSWIVRWPTASDNKDTLHYVHLYLNEPDCPWR